MIPFFLGTLLGAFLGYAMGSYAMLARPELDEVYVRPPRRTRTISARLTLVGRRPPRSNLAELSDAEMHEVARLLDQPVEFVAMAGGRN